ncbi:MAG: HlyD family efflux transporter periplasmic adaptor subunit [Planctomycetaceae bacterium]|nr:HlyD family efflux transporter periplasmic adaptor subunit [Planctomycetaceae bacterium]
MKAAHNRVGKISLSTRFVLSRLLLAVLTLLISSPLPAQTSETSAVQATGVLESSEVELLQASVLDGTRIVKVIPHGSRVTQETPLLEFEHRQSPVEKARRQLLKAELELRSTLKELEVLEHFTRPRTLAELQEREKEASRNVERTKLSGEAQLAMKKAQVATLTNEYHIVLSRYEKLKELEEIRRDELLLEEYAIRSVHLEAKLKTALKEVEQQCVQNERQLAEANFETKLAKLDLIQYQEGDYIAQKEALETQIEAAKDKLSRQREKYEKIIQAVRQKQILAPVDGIVFHHDSRIAHSKPFSLEPGSRVKQGQVLLKFASLESRQVRVPVCESNILRINEGQSATVHFTALPTQEFSATVISISEVPRFEKLTSDGCVNYDVILDMTDLPAELKLGMTCEVKFLSD